MANPVSDKPASLLSLVHVLNKPVKALISLFLAKLKYTAKSYPRAVETRPPAFFPQGIVFKQAAEYFQMKA
jgi:hypothetical protein